MRFYSFDCKFFGITRIKKLNQVRELGLTLPLYLNLYCIEECFILIYCLISSAKRQGYSSADLQDCQK